jgi:hypothetical protein
MKKILIILNICIMASTASFAQTKLKNGVYEFYHIDTTKIYEGQPTNSRTLIVKKDTVLYQIRTSADVDFDYSGTFLGLLLDIRKNFR